MVKKICFAAVSFLTVIGLELLACRADVLAQIALQFSAVIACAPASFFCARVVLPAGRIKWLLLPLPAVLFTLPYPLLYRGRQEPFAVAILLGWCLLWSLAGLIRRSPMDDSPREEARPEKASPKLLWVWRPLGNCLLLVLGFMAAYVWTAMEGSDWGGLVYALGFVMLYDLILIPLMTVFYCRRIGYMGWPKYLCCLYNAVVLGLYFTVGTIPFNTEPVDLQYIAETAGSALGLSAMVSALLCGVATLVAGDVKRSAREKKSA